MPERGRHGVGLEACPHDVIDILFCGVCHSDIHQVKNEWRNIAETQVILDFFTEHQIGPNYRSLPDPGNNDAYEKVEKGDVRFRYIDGMSSLKLDETN